MLLENISMKWEVGISGVEYFQKKEKKWTKNIVENIQQDSTVNISFVRCILLEKHNTDVLYLKTTINSWIAICTLPENSTIKNFLISEDSAINSSIIRLLYLKIL